MIIILIFVLFSIVTYMISGNFLHLMLIWNLFLAILPLIIQYKFFQQPKYRQYFCLFLWLILIPNTFYLVTDLIHIQFIEFKTIVSPYESYYVLHISPWLEMLNLFAYASIGVILGSKSVLYFSHAIQRAYLRYAYEIIVSILISCGIYIGRFLRFNSWDILSLPSLINKISLSIDVFTIHFILLFSVSIFAALQIARHYKKK